jgi:hypothetical protein
MPSKLPRSRKPAEQLRRRNRPEEWTVLPFEGCSLPLPKWPLGSPSGDESALWKSLWKLPVALFWHDQRIEPTVIARYARLALDRPEHATVSALERELGLTPAAMLRMRLIVEAPEAEPEPVDDPYQHLRAAAE